MRVALDARSMQPQPMGGVGRVVARVLPHVAERVDVELLTADDQPPLTGVDSPIHVLRTPWPHVQTAWLQWSAPRWLSGFDGIFHCPWYALPFKQPVPMVVSLHDLTFERFPNQFARGRRTSYVVQARWAARTAKIVLTGSHAVADDIMTTYGVPASRVIVAPNSVDDIFRPDLDATPTLERLGVTRPYVVAVGGNPRRRLEVAVAVWREVRVDHAIDLIVVGTEDVPRESGIAGGRLGDDEWPAVLAGAQALVYPTEYEGYGMPALEAITSGTPVICAPVGSLPEVVGDAAAWCDVPEVPQVAEQLRRLLDNPEWAADLRAAGLARAAAHPTWADTAAGHLEAYRLAASA